MENNPTSGHGKPRRQATMLSPVKSVASQDSLAGYAAGGVDHRRTGDKRQFSNKIAEAIYERERD